MDITFIVGCARSGTSILGELIRAHPKVMYVYEEPIWRLAEGDSHRVSVDDVAPVHRTKIRKWLKMYKRKNKIVVEKNPRHTVRIPLLKEMFPEAKIIHIVRDGRDVACSLKTGLCGKTWAHVKPPRWKEIESSYEGVMRCAHAWKDVVEIAIHDLKNYEHLQVKYEDLVTNPEEEAKRIFKYLGIRPHDKAIEFTKKIKNDMGGYVAGGQLRWYTRDHKTRIGRWKENMTVSEQEEVDQLLTPLLTYLGYK